MYSFLLSFTFVHLKNKEFSNPNSLLLSKEHFLKEKPKKKEREKRKGEKNASLNGIKQTSMY